MAKLRAPGEATVVTPADQKDAPAEARITYTLRTPSLYDRVKLERAVAAAGGTSHGALEMLRALKRGIEVVMADSPPASREATLALVARYETDLTDFYEQVRAGDLEEGAAFDQAIAAVEAGGIDIGAIERSVAMAYKPYGAMVADNAVYPEILAIEAARLFLSGWSGASMGAFAAGPDGADEACLMKIDPAHLREIGRAVQGLLRPSRDEEKNLSSPSSTPSGPKTSAASKTPAPARPS